MAKFISVQRANKEFTTSDHFKNFKKQYNLLMSNLSLIYTKLGNYQQAITLDLEVKLSTKLKQFNS